MQVFIFLLSFLLLLLLFFKLLLEHAAVLNHHIQITLQLVCFLLHVFVQNSLLVYQNIFLQQFIQQLFNLCALLFNFLDVLLFRSLWNFLLNFLDFNIFLLNQFIHLRNVLFILLNLLLQLLDFFVPFLNLLLKLDPLAFSIILLVF